MCALEALANTDEGLLQLIINAATSREFDVLTRLLFYQVTPGPWGTPQQGTTALSPALSLFEWELLSTWSNPSKKSPNTTNSAGKHRCQRENYCARWRDPPQPCNTLFPYKLRSVRGDHILLPSAEIPMGRRLLCGMLIMLCLVCASQDN